MNNSKRIPIGYLVKPHGLNGEFKVFLYNKESQTLTKGILLWLKIEDNFESFLIEDIRGIKRNIIKLENSQIRRIYKKKN